MIVASHHRKGHALASDTDYVPAQAWPERCHVQWGANGIVLGKESYNTAFFEAFPGDTAGGFIRGEGKTISDAEEACFRRYAVEVACDHRWGRRNYTNGGALCHRCGAFRTEFRPVAVDGAHRKPLSGWEADWLLTLEERDGPMKPDIAKAYRILRIRKHLFGVVERKRGDRFAWASGE